jgi:hypothetical protein
VFDDEQLRTASSARRHVQSVSDRCRPTRRSSHVQES